MSKGSNRRPGSGYGEGFDRIWSKDKPQPREAPEKDLAGLDHSGEIDGGEEFTPKAWPL